MIIRKVLCSTNCHSWKWLNGGKRRTARSIRELFDSDTITMKRSSDSLIPMAIITRTQCLTIDRAASNDPLTGLHTI